MHWSLVRFPWQSGPVQAGPSAGGCVRVSVGGRAVGSRAGSVTVREQSVSLIGPPRPQSTITLLCLSPPSPWQHHMIAQNVGLSILCVCTVCLLVLALLNGIVETLVKQISTLGRREQERSTCRKAHINQAASHQWWRKMPKTNCTTFIIPVSRTSLLHESLEDVSQHQNTIKMVGKKVKSTSVSS